MAKKLWKAYLGILVAAVVFLLFVGVRFTTNIYQEKGEQAGELYTGLSVVERTNDTLVLRGMLPERELGNECLGFLTSHEEVRIYVSGGLVYALNKGPNLFGSTTGHVWNLANMRTRHAAKQVTIQIRSIYEDRPPTMPTIYIGSKTSLLMMIVQQNILVYAVCILALLIGIVMLAYWWYVHRHTDIAADLLYLGTFSILLGIWSLNEVPINVLAFQNHVITSYTAYMSLMLLPIPFVLFVRSLYHDEQDWAWNLVVLAAMCNVVAQVVCQVFRIRDMSQMLVYSHVVLGLTVLIIIFYTVREVCRGELDRRVKVHIGCILMDMAGVAADVLKYYFRPQDFDSNLFGRLAFFLHIVLLGWAASRESAILMKKGREAVIYERLAYRDQLTELFNRTAFEEDMERLWQERESTLIVIMDLNDLKKCNDTMGHDAGDRYIKNAARIINMVFRDKGKCYRIGGDEFCAVMDVEDKVEANCFARLWELAEEYNKGSAAEQIAIAYGYARYDGNRDENLQDTRNRADVMMYENKKEMKTGMVI